MAKINKALFWSLFAAGGTVTAFVFPVLALIVLIAAYGNPPEIMAYDQMRGLLANWFGKLVAFGIVSLALWHAVHRGPWPLAVDISQFLDWASCSARACPRLTTSSKIAIVYTNASFHMLTDKQAMNFMGIGGLSIPKGVWQQHD